MFSRDNFELNRTIRVFISSTFLDMMEEREYLMKKTFPGLRSFCKDRQVELTEIDLRWGIPEEEAQRGKVITTCLRQIDDCHPYFIGILGGRYGWIPDKEDLGDDIEFNDHYPWDAEELEKQALSITEMEIQYGVLKNPDLDKKAWFYLKNEKIIPNDFKEEKGSESSIKLATLRNNLNQQTKFPVRKYNSVAELGKLIRKDLEQDIEKEFPINQQPSNLDLLRNEHEKCLLNHTKLYIPDDNLIKHLDLHFEGQDQPLVVFGLAGTGKSALLANWIKRFRKKNPSTKIFFHFVGGGFL